MTKTKKPSRPRAGGSYIRDPKTGALKAQTEPKGTLPADPPAGDPPAETKEA